MSWQRPETRGRALRNDRALRIVCVAGMVLGASAGCAPRIGDGCGNSSNCSINADRLCDTTQPGGYCLVFDCLPNSCPEDAVCVRFNDVNDEPACREGDQSLRRAVVACMRACSTDGDCRTGDGYRCLDTTRLANEAPALCARVLDRGRGNPTFCVARPPAPPRFTGTDGGPFDAGSSDANTGDAGQDSGADAAEDGGPAPSDAGPLDATSTNEDVGAPDASDV